LKTLDRYIIGKYLGTFFYIVFLLIAITVVIDLSEKLDDFIEKAPPVDEIFKDYYLNFIPYMVSLLAPFFIFISVIFFTSKLASNSEIIAILGGGISYTRLMYPYLLAAGLLAGGLYLANNWVVPYANKGRLKFEYTYLKNKFYNPNRYQHLQIADETFIYIENFSFRDSVGYRFTFEKFEDKALQYKLFASKIKFISSLLD
jgi:lipopolysaccharide export system permease protein